MPRAKIVLKGLAAALSALSLSVLSSCLYLGATAQDNQAQQNPGGINLRPGTRLAPRNTQAPTYLIEGKPATEAQYQAAQLTNEGIMAIRAGQNNEALEKLKKAVEYFEPNAQAHNSLGLVYAKLGNTPEALKETKRALELDPNVSASWVNLGGIYQSMGNLTEAIAAYNEFVKRFPSHSMVPQIKGLIKGLNQEKAQRPANAQAQTDGASQNGEDYLALMSDSQTGLKRWTKMPITVFITDGSSVPEYRPSMTTILKQSFEDWSKASGGSVSFSFVDNPKDAALRVIWTDKLTDLHNPAEAGEARLTLDRGGIRSAEVWLVTKPLSKILPLTDNLFRVVCLHELGHALGLSGHTTNPDDAMFYSASFRDVWRELSPRDAHTISKLYK